MSIGASNTTSEAWSSSIILREGRRHNSRYLENWATDTKTIQSEKLRCRSHDKYDCACLLCVCCFSLKPEPHILSIVVFLRLTWRLSMPTGKSTWTCSSVRRTTSNTWMSTTRLETGQMSTYRGLKHTKTGKAHLYVGVCMSSTTRRRVTLRTCWSDWIKSLTRSTTQSSKMCIRWRAWSERSMWVFLFFDTCQTINVTDSFYRTKNHASCLFVCVFVQDQAKAMEHFDDRVKALQKRSLQVLPLSYRRETPQKLLPIEALCEFDTDEVLPWGSLFIFECLKLKETIISSIQVFTVERTKELTPTTLPAVLLPSSLRSKCPFLLQWHQFDFTFILCYGFLSVSDSQQSDASGFSAFITCDKAQSTNFSLRSLNPVTLGCYGVIIYSNPSREPRLSLWGCILKALGIRT